MRRFLFELDFPERLWWIPHNLIAHPLMAILPRTWGMKVHDWTIPREAGRKETPLS